MTSIVTGQQYYIGAGSYRATVTGLGAGLRELVFGAQPVIDGYSADELPPGGAGQLLAPWPNRVDAGRYVFDGTGFQLALTEPEHANAIHGLTRWRCGHPSGVKPAPWCSAAARTASRDIRSAWKRRWPSSP